MVHFILTLQLRAFKVPAGFWLLCSSSYFFWGKILHRWVARSRPPTTPIIQWSVSDRVFGSLEVDFLESRRVSQSLTNFYSPHLICDIFSRHASFVPRWGWGPCGRVIAQRDYWNNRGRNGFTHSGTIKMTFYLEPPRSTATKSWIIQRDGFGTDGLVHIRHFPRRGSMHDCRGYPWSDSFDFLRNELWSWKVRELYKSLELPSIHVFFVRTTACKTGEHVLLPSLS